MGQRQPGQRLPTPDEAFIHFCKLGSRRNFMMLKRWYGERRRWTGPSLATISKWSQKGDWKERAAEYDVETTNLSAKRAAEVDAQERVEVSMIVEDAYRDILGRMRQHLAKMPQIKTPTMILELVSAAGLLHGQLMEIQRGKMPDQALLEKIVQEMAGASRGNGNGSPPSDDELERLLELAKAEPGKPLN